MLYEVITDASRSRAVQSYDHIDKCAFTATAFSDEGDLLALTDGQIQII